VSVDGGNPGASARRAAVAGGRGGASRTPRDGTIWAGRNTPSPGRLGAVGRRCRVWLASAIG